MWRVSSFIQLGRERHYESKVSCPRTQRSALAMAQIRTDRSGVQYKLDRFKHLF